MFLCFSHFLVFFGSLGFVLVVGILQVVLNKSGAIWQNSIAKS